MRRTGDLTAYRPDVDGLRCVAIVLVILFHIGFRRVGGGFVGVDVFFAISGYLIGSHVYRETRRGTFSLRNFYERRAKRILPAFFCVMFAVYLLGCLILSAGELRRLAAQAFAAVASCSNLYFWIKEGYFAPRADMSPLLMTWSLGVEEQFYLFFPLLMMMCRRMSSRRLLGLLGGLTALSFVLSVWAVARYPTAAFYLLPMRAWEIGAGCMLGIFEVEFPQNAVLRARGSRTEGMALAGLVVLLGSSMLYSKATRFPGAAALLPVGAAIVLIRTRESHVNRWVLSAKPLVWIGLVSYSWYLWHWPLLSFARLATGGTLSIANGCALGVGALVLAVFSYFAVERPFRRTARTGPRLLAGYGMACLAFAVPAVVMIAARGWPNRYPQATRIETAAAVGSKDSCLADYGESHPVSSAACMHPHRNDQDKPVLALMGDSHAASLAYALRNEVEANGWVFDDLTKASCPQLGSVTRAMLSHPKHADECAAYNKAALDYVVGNPDIHTVVLAGFWSVAFPVQAGYGYVHSHEEARGTVEQNWSNFQSGLEETVRRLRRCNKDVILALDVPRFEVDPLTAAIGDAVPMRSQLRRLLERGDVERGWEPMQLAISIDDRQADRMVEQVAAETGAHVLDLSRGLCDGAVCRYTLNGDSLYLDEQHLSALGARTALQDANLF